MKILLLGAAGQLGRELKRSLATQGELITCERRSLDLNNADALADTLKSLAPDLIVNAAAYTAVDKAESDSATAFMINATVPGVLADYAKAHGARLIHYSTDYVFNGSGHAAWNEHSTTAPLSIYGQSKLAGEQAIQASGCRHMILRTSWVFGLHGSNFMKTMLRLARDKDELGIIDDQYGAPTWTRHLADATAMLAARPEAHGLYHLANAGETTWAGYAEAIFAEATRLGLLDKAPHVRRITSADFPLPAKRPNNSRLDCAALARDHGITLPDWRIALSDCLADAIH
ncbi:MAG: dTDP-4-dehydrorhamnose reductase [Rhodocyclaceae bacterium]|nr:dTDP-4-dehydrorhamnose reductase [Rhodocyclaceae bacterium]